MRNENEAAFQQSLEEFTAYAQTEAYQRDEREYKEHLIRTLGAVLTDETLNAPDFLGSLRDAVRKSRSAISNLTHQYASDDFKKYLDAVPEERIGQLLRDLFDESRDLAERVDAFKGEADADYALYLPRDKKDSYLTYAILLSAHAPDTYIFYRQNAITYVCKLWDIPLPQGKTRGEIYVAYLDFLKPIRERLSNALGRPADLIDVHSFLWYTYNQRPREAAASWREKLAEWLQTNSKTIPEDLRQLREEFVRRFPKERLGEMTLEEYAVGTGDKNNFSYWLEYKTKELGRVGSGDANKTGVWWKKSEKGWQWNDKLYSSPDDALAPIKKGLVRLVKATQEGRFDDLDKIGEEQMGTVRYLRSKPLYLYFPEQFLPMWQPEHIANFLKLFDAEPQGEVLSRNRQLLNILRGLPDFEGFDTFGMMRFLYESFPQTKSKGSGIMKPPEPMPQPVPHAEPPVTIPRELAELMDTTTRTRNVLLYGPPGTGKTWLVNHFTNYFLLYHNVSVEAASN